MAAPPNCANCGKFVNCEEGVSHFTPDSDYSVETLTWLCRPCSDRKRAERSKLGLDMAILAADLGRSPYR